MLIGYPTLTQDPRPHSGMLNSRADSALDSPLSDRPLAEHFLIWVDHPHRRGWMRMTGEDGRCGLAPAGATRSEIEPDPHGGTVQGHLQGQVAVRDRIRELQVQDVVAAGE